MTFLHLDSGARLQGSNTRTLGQYLVNALELGVPMYNFGIPEPLRQWIDASGSASGTTPRTAGVNSAARPAASEVG